MYPKAYMPLERTELVQDETWTKLAVVVGLGRFVAKNAREPQETGKEGPS